MKILAHVPWLVLGAFIALPTIAHADFTVTVRNKTDDLVEIQANGHYCIHDPSNFNKSIPAHGSVQIAAKWVDGCGGLAPSFIMLSVKYGLTERCFKVLDKDDYKSLVVVADPPGDLPYLGLASDPDANDYYYDCWPDDPGGL